MKTLYHPSIYLRHVRSTIHLYPLEETPHYLQDNPYITAGYRCYLSARQCLRSMFVLSNELVNIWTHLSMVFVFFVLMIYDHAYLLPYNKAKLSDHFVILTFTICVQVCMTFSVLFHTFNCHTLESVCEKSYALDLLGILIGITGCYIPGLHYGFYCFTFWRSIYQFSIAIFILTSVVFMTQPNYLAPSRNHRRKVHLILITLYGIVPAVHWLIISPWNEVILFLPKVITLYVILGMAFGFYVSKFPECYMPGKFNLIGQSHNIWHVLTAASFLYWRNAGFELMRYRLTNACTLGT